MSGRKSSRIWHTWRSERAEDHELEALQTNCNQSACIELLSAFYFQKAKKSDFSPACIAYCDWYMKFIAKSFKAMPSEYKQVCVQSDDPTKLETMELHEFQRLMIRMCKALHENDNPCLSDVTEALGETNLLHADKASKEEVTQLVFCSLGLVSMIFAPSYAYKPGILAIALPPKTSRKKPSDTWQVDERSISAIDGSFVDTLRGFASPSGPIPRYLDTSASVPGAHTLEALNLNFYIISQLGGLKIVWVDSVCMHLELDRREKTLMIFRHPAFCAMLYFGGDTRIFLDQVFQTYLADIGATSDTDTISPAGDFFREVLMTFRLIFGQDKSSWKLAKSFQSPGRIRSMREKLTGRSRASLSWEDVSDPLLQALCACDGGEEQLYDDLELPDARSVYSAQQDFPYFGQRLIAIQEYIRLVQPYDLQTLWYDRRDANRFYTIWAVIAFSMLTLVLALIGIVLAAAQVAGSFAKGEN